MKRVGVALLGLGTVGSGVARLLTEHAERLKQRCGIEFVLRHVVVRDPAKQRPIQLPAETQLQTSLDPVEKDPEVEIAIELWGGIEPAREAVVRLLRHGKHIVTANKALLAEHGPEIFDEAQRNDRSIAFEASVAGGIPIVGALAHGLSANRVHYVRGVLNGTSNYILTAMTEGHQTYAEALAEAQAKGYAEADPTLDVDGTDAAQKLAILIQLAFGQRVLGSQVQRRGITGIQQADLRYAGELGYVIKLLAIARMHENGIEARVTPCLVRHRSPLAQVRDAYNAIQIKGDAVGEMFFYGLGAGQMPTASAVVADLIDTALGRAQITFRMLRMWASNDRGMRLLEPEEVESRFYYRFSVQDRPGVLAQIARVLGDHGVSIASVIQHEPPCGQASDTVPLVLMTHRARTSDALASLEEIDRLPVVSPPSVLLPVED